MEWEVINIKEINKKYRFTIVLNWKRYNELLLLMKSLNTKQKAKAINYLIDMWSNVQYLDDLLKKDK